MVGNGSEEKRGRQAVSRYNLSGRPRSSSRENSLLTLGGSLHGGSSHSRFRRPSIRRTQSNTTNNPSIRRRHSGDQLDELRKSSQLLTQSKKADQLLDLRKKAQERIQKKKKFNASWTEQSNGEMFDRSWSEFASDHQIIDDASSEDSFSLSSTSRKSDDDDDDDDDNENSFALELSEEDEEEEEEGGESEDYSVELEGQEKEVPVKTIAPLPPPPPPKQQDRPPSSLMDKNTHVRWNSSPPKPNSQQFRRSATTAKSYSAYSNMPTAYDYQLSQPPLTTTRQRRNNGSDVDNDVNDHHDDHHTDDNDVDDDLEQGKKKKHRWKPSSAHSDVPTMTCQELLCVDMNKTMTTLSKSHHATKYKRLLVVVMALFVFGCLLAAITRIVSYYLAQGKEETVGLLEELG